MTPGTVTPTMCAAQPRGLAFALGALMLIGMGCSTTLVNRTEVEGSGPLRRVHAVVIEGNDAISDGDLLSGIVTRAPRGVFTTSITALDMVTVEADQRRIQAYYRQRGYFSAKVARVAVTGNEWVTVTFTVNEGPATRVTAVRAQGGIAGGALSNDEVVKELGIGVGDVFVHAEYELAKQRMLGRFLRAGHAHAQVTAEVQVDRSKAQAAIEWRIDPGPVVRFGKTTVRGLVRIPESSVRYRVVWTEGDVFDPAKLERTQGQLYRFDAFGLVRFDYERDRTSTVANITIYVTEKTRHEIRLGGGAGVDQAHYEVRGRAGYTERGFLDALTTLELDGRPAYSLIRTGAGRAGFGGEALAALRRDDLFLPRLRGEVSVAYSQVELESYSARGPRARAFFDRSFFGSRITAGAGWQLRGVDFYRIDGAIDATTRQELGFVSGYRVGFFEQSIALDLRDDPLDASRGFYLELRAEESGAWAGSLFDYIRLSPEARGYLPLGWRSVLAVRGRLGFRAQGDVLPVTQRFFGGGASSQRGFGQRELSPFVTGDDGQIPVGGEASLETSAELRVNVTKLADNWFGVVVFLDGGDVTPAVGDLDPAHLHWALGGGIRYRTPVGPLRLDFGWRLNRTGVGEPQTGDRWQIHFTLGEAF